MQLTESCGQRLARFAETSGCWLHNCRLAIVQPIDGVCTGCNAEEEQYPGRDYANISMPSRAITVVTVASNCWLRTGSVVSKACARQCWVLAYS